LTLPLALCYLAAVITEVPALFRNFARQVMHCEAGEAGNADKLALALERACTSLHVSLAPLISSLGFHLLLRRALDLAARDFPFLVTVQVAAKQHVSLQGLREALEGRNRDQMVEGLIAVLAHVFSLLVLFIGENLAWRKVSEIWPEISLREIGDSSEKIEE
jgi:hypothetical protein